MFAYQISGLFPVRRLFLSAGGAAAALLGLERCGFGLVAVGVGMGMSVGVFDVYRGNSVGCLKGRDMIGVVFSRGVEPRCEVRTMSCVRFGQWVLGAGMVGCAIIWGFCYLLRGVRGSVLGDQRCCWVREDVFSVRSGRQGRKAHDSAVRGDLGGGGVEGLVQS